MIRQLKCISLVVIVFLLSVDLLFSQVGSSTVPDLERTRETKALYKNLKTITAKGFLFGHQDDLAYGVNWRYEKGRSDVKDVAGDYPALYGWELGGIELGHAKNLDGVPFDAMKQFIRDGYERGGVITISWHASSPFGYAGGAWDTTKGTVASILPGGVNHALFLSWLDKVADFIHSLKGKKGEAIPVLFRPFHELTGSWFWWGKNECTPAEFKAIWKFTFHYLQTEKGLHNLLWVYNTAGDFTTKEEYLERYPGNELVDVISFDTYQSGDPKQNNQFIKKVQEKLSILDSAAVETNKPTAIAEAGYEQVPDARWWTGTLLKAIGTHRISYVLVWRNHGYHETMKKMHYYAPYKGQISAPDFLQFYKHKKTLFEKDGYKLKLYQ